MLIEYISLASGFNFTILAVVLYRRNALNTKSTNILIRLLLFLALYSSVVFFHYMAVDKGNKGILSYYLPIDGILLATLAPNLYWYIMATLEVPVHRNRLTVFLHSLAFIPFIAFNLYFVTLNQTDRMDWLIRDFHAGTLENNLLNAVLYMQILIYLYVSYVRVRKKQQQTCDNNTVFVTPNFNWLKNYLLINLIYTLMSIPICFYFANERANIIIGQLAMDIQFVYLFFKITTNNELTNKSQYVENKATLKTQKINTDTADEVLAKLTTYMVTEKPYLHEGCSVQTVANNTGIPPHQLSTILNCKLQKSFPDYINEYRIITTRQKLLSAQSDKLTIESVAHECGFGSKSSFHRTFKKHSNNLTPSEYIKQHKNLLNQA